MNISEAIEVFDKSAERTKPNVQTEAWSVIREKLDELAVAEMDRDYYRAIVYGTWPDADKIIEGLRSKREPNVWEWSKKPRVEVIR